jgi:hypothetical protein
MNIPGLSEALKIRPVEYCFLPDDAILPSSGPASLNTRGGTDHRILEYDDTSTEVAHWAGVIHEAYAGRDVRVQLYWVSASATTGDVRWGVNWERLAPGGDDIDSVNWGTEEYVDDAARSPSGSIIKTEFTFTQAEADGIDSSDAFRLSVSRIGGHANDTMSGDAQLIRVVVIA